MGIPASFVLSEPPLSISTAMSLDSSLIGKPNIFNANVGVAPIAYMSDKAFAAAICPNTYGSSTTGVKKSTV